MTREIPLTHSKIALVDDEDYEKINQFKWWVMKHHGNWYVSTTMWKPRRNIYLHRLLLSPNKNEIIDHINHDGLDNRRCNLRIVTNSQNHMNTVKKPNTSSKYKGVYWNKSHGRWFARIQGIKAEFIGYFKTEEEAGRAYDEAVKKVFGEFASLNFSNLRGEKEGKET